MNKFFVFMMIVSFGLTLLSDRKKLSEAKKPEKFVYWGFASLVLLLLFSGTFDVDVMFPTKWIISEVAPQVREFMMNMQ